MKISVFLLVVFFSAEAFSFEWIFALKNKQKTPVILQLQDSDLKDSKAGNFSDSIEVHKTTGKFLVPLNSDLENRFSFSTDVEYIDLQQHNKRSPNPIPSDLTKIESNLTYVHNEYAGEAHGGFLQVGSASDEPFSEMEVTEIQATAFYYQEKNENHSFVYLVNYSNLRSFLPNIPLPGIVYVYSKGREFNLFAGFPFAGFTWSFLERWQLNYLNVFLYTNSLKLGYTLFGPAQIYTEFQTSPKTFKLRDTREEEDRLIFEEKSVKLGFKYPITNLVILDAFVGRTLNRRIYGAERVGKSKDWVENIENQTYYNLQFGFRF